MNADKVDTLIMLLSTDWFLPYWGLIGMYLEDGPQICVQQGCRDIVQEIVSGRAEYYHVDFSQKRVEATRRAFIALLKNCGADPGIPVELLLSNGTDAIFEEGTQWLITVLTGRLLQGRRLRCIRDADQDKRHNAERLLVRLPYRTKNQRSICNPFVALRLLFMYFVAIRCPTCC